jgi:hypothetical protein
MNLTDALIGIIGLLSGLCAYLLKLAIVNPLGNIEKKTAILEIRVIKVEGRLDALENK